jgi:hypothetical protein
MAVNWAGIGWRLGTRLIEESKSSKGVEYGKPAEPMDVGQMIVKIINGLNNAPLIPNIPSNGLKAPYNVVDPAPPAIVSSTAPLPQGDTGIRVGTVGTCPKSSVGPWFYQNALGGISLIASTFSGFDWEIEPVEPYKDALGTVFGLFNCAQGHAHPEDAFGKYRPDVVFEYGDGKNNVAEWTELIDATGLLNRAFAAPGLSNTESEEVVMQYDWQGMADRNCVYEDSVPSSVVTTDLRNALLQEQVIVRRYPRSVITFKPTADPQTSVMPEYGTEWGLGDIFRFRAVEYGVETFNGLCRVYEAEFQIDDSGNELVTPILVEQET